MKTSQVFPSKYLKAADLEDNDVTLTIASCEMETVGQGNDQEEKPVLYFKKTKKGLVLNKTNMNVIENLYGDETDDWIGEQITLFPTVVEFSGKQVDAIRVKNPKKAKGPARKRAVPEREEDDEEEQEEAPPPKKASNKLTGGKGRKPAEDDDEDQDIPF